MRLSTTWRSHPERPFPGCPGAMRAGAPAAGLWNAKAPKRAEAGAEANNDKAIATDMMMRDMVTSNEPMLTDWSPVAQTWFSRQPVSACSGERLPPT